MMLILSSVKLLRRGGLLTAAHGQNQAVKFADTVDSGNSFPTRCYETSDACTFRESRSVSPQKFATSCNQLKAFRTSGF